MNDIAKSRAKTIESSKTDSEYELDTLEKTLNATKHSVITIKEEINSSINRINSKLVELKNNSTSLVSSIEELKKEYNIKERGKLSADFSELVGAIEKLKKIYFKKELDLKNVDKNLSFFTEKTVCPTCTQPFSEELVHAKKEEAINQKAQYESELKKISDMCSELDKKGTELNTKITRLDQIGTELTRHYDELDNLKQKISFYLNERKTQEERLNSIKPQIGIEEIEKQIQNVQDKIAVFTSQLKSYNTVFSLLKDDGIKTIIVKNYLSIINTLIKKFLSIINFNVSFVFDTNFNETIKSRGRDIFEYNCFSEGERLRIDYCLLFTFRELARLRSTVDTNLLIIDEQDGRLDTEGVQAINTLLNTMNGNTIIISQYADIYEDIATKQIFMKKENHFTQAIIL